MKKIIYLTLCIVFLISCVFQENKNSRKTISKYTEIFNKIIVEVTDSKDQEIRQTPSTVDNHFEKYIEMLDRFQNDLIFEEISEKYLHRRDELISISKQMTRYLNLRKLILERMMYLYSSFDSIKQLEVEIAEYEFKRDHGYYSSSLAQAGINCAYKLMNERLTFIKDKKTYIEDFQEIHTLYVLINNKSKAYNKTLIDDKLSEKLFIPKKIYEYNWWLVISK